MSVWLAGWTGQDQSGENPLSFMHRSYTPSVYPSTNPSIHALDFPVFISSWYFLVAASADLTFSRHMSFAAFHSGERVAQAGKRRTIASPTSRHIIWRSPSHVTEPGLKAPTVRRRPSARSNDPGCQRAEPCFSSRRVKNVAFWLSINRSRKIVGVLFCWNPKSMRELWRSCVPMHILRSQAL